MPHKDLSVSPQMQQLIEKLAAKHGLNLAATESHQRLELEGYMPLVIEKIGRHLVSVAHYGVLNGDVMRDPEVVFLTNYPTWIPIEITQDYSSRYDNFATITPRGQVVAWKPAGQAVLANFVSQWAENLREQGWLDKAKGQSLERDWVFR